MAILDQTSGQTHIKGLSTDTKPTQNVVAGSTFIEADTGAEYVFTGVFWKQFRGSGGKAASVITVWPHTLATHTVTGAGTAYNLPSGRFTVQASSDNNGGTFTSGTVDIEASNDNDLWIIIAQLSLTGDNDSDGLSLPDANYAYIRSNCSALSETGSTPQIVVTINI